MKGDDGITKESFAQLDPSFFDEHFSDHRRARRKRYDQPDFEKLAKRLTLQGTTLRSRSLEDKAAIVADTVKHVWPWAHSTRIMTSSSSPAWWRRWLSAAAPSCGCGAGLHLEDQFASEATTRVSCSTS